ncbi:MAG: TlpA disulfide reductase family protein [Candidatus Woesearchaeota archaeon]
MKKILLLLVLITACVPQNKIIDESDNGVEWIQGNFERNDYYLLHFFNSQCSICIEQANDLKEIQEKTPEVKIIGVHLPEFLFQKKKEIILPEIEKAGITYSVVSDRNHTIRMNHSIMRVPSFVLLDSKANVIEKTVELKKIKARLASIYPERGISLKAPVRIISEKTTPKLYGGYAYARKGEFGNINETHFEVYTNYNLPKIILENKIYVEGEWFANQDRLNFISRSPGKMIVRFYGNKVSMLARSRAREFETIEKTLEERVAFVLVDGKPIPKENAGKDILYEKDGTSYLMIEPYAKVYDIAKFENEERRTLEFYPPKGRFNLFWIEFS